MISAILGTNFVAAALGVATLTTLVTPAQSQDPFQFWVNEHRRNSGAYPGQPGWDQRRYGDDRYRDRRYYDTDGRYDERDDRYGNESRRLPQVRVDSPSFYTYKPDTPVTTDVAAICEIEVAGNDDATTIGAATPVAGDTQAAANGADSAVDANNALASDRVALPQPANPFLTACAVAKPGKLVALPEVAKAIKAHYSKKPHFIWSDGTAINAKADSALKALQDSQRFALSPDDYRVDRPNVQNLSAEERSKALIDFEIALSAKVLTYVLDARRGRIDPNKLSGYHDLPRKSVDLVAALDAIEQSDEPARAIEASHPDNPNFKSLVAALDQLRASSKIVPVSVPDGTKIRPGESDPELNNFIKTLRVVASEDLKAAFPDILVDNQTDHVVFVPRLVELVRAFQKNNGLNADGIIGKNTIAALERRTPSDKIAKLELAIERMRWLPHAFGNRHVFLNQPAFTVSYVVNDRPELTMAVVVGKKSNQTYFFTDRIKAVEYNPDWGVPRSIIVNEMVPKLVRDPSYLDRLGYEVMTSSGRRVSSRSVDWHRVAYNKASVDVRQPPGPKNALGRLKIVFPNKHAIYLHDTPQKKLFSEKQRAFSHGCVRLKDPQAMAAAVLGTSKSHVASRIADGQSTSEEVNGDVSVYLAYFTAWPNADGTVGYYDDIYDRDEYLSKAIEKTTVVRRAS